MITFGDNILLWRLHKSFSQEQLASLSGIPRPNLSNIEKGKQDVTLSTIRALSNALEVSPGILVDGEAPKNKSWKKDFSRESMERIANSVAEGKSPKNRAERHICHLLKQVIYCRLQLFSESGKPLPLPGRNSARAWLLLHALFSKETVNSLIMRALEHAEKQWTDNK